MTTTNAGPDANARIARGRRADDVLCEEMSAPSDTDTPPQRRGAGQTQELLALCANVGLFRDADGEAWVRFPVNGHHETCELRAKAFRSWVTHAFFEAQRKPAAQPALDDVLSLLEARALFDSRSHVQAVSVRVASVPEGIAIDLGDESWRSIAVTPTGHALVGESAARFRRARGIEALPLPQTSRGIDELRRFINVGSHDDFVLAVAWLVAALRPRGPYPVLIVNGEQGSAKSTTSRVLRSLIDPHAAGLRAPPKDVRDLMIGATNGHVLAFDNLSDVPPQLADALCRLSTGGSFAVRKNYSDREETLFTAQRPIILNGIPELSTRSDLLDRAIILRCPSIPAEMRRTEAELWKDFEDARPRIFGALLDGVASALKNIDSVVLSSSPRLADFARWVVAAETGLGFPAGTFIRAYERNRIDANAMALEASRLANAVIDLASEGFDGTATAMLSALTRLVAVAPPGWPRTARKLVSELARLAPNLRVVGVRFERGARSSRGTPYTLTRDDADSRPSQRSQPSPRASHSLAVGERCDGRDGSPQLFDDDSGADTARSWNLT